MKEYKTYLNEYQIKTGHKCPYYNDDCPTCGKTDSLTEVVELIVIDYANLSGRESANRAEFRKLTREHLERFLALNK